MKRIVFAIIAAVSLVLGACSYGVYSVNSGMADKGYVGFVDRSAYDIEVIVDGERFSSTTIKQAKAYKARRDIKATSRRMVMINPGKHDVKVERNGKQIYSQTIFVSATETKLINL